MSLNNANKFITSDNSTAKLLFTNIQIWRFSNTLDSHTEKHAIQTGLSATESTVTDSRNKDHAKTKYHFSISQRMQVKHFQL